jgi:hypothetical protein
LLDRAIDAFPYPCAIQGFGIITFAEQSEFDTAFAFAGRFKLKHEISTLNGTPVFCRPMVITPVRMCWRPIRTTSHRDCPAWSNNS